MKRSRIRQLEGDLREARLALIHVDELLQIQLRMLRMQDVEKASFARAVGHWERRASAAAEFAHAIMRFPGGIHYPIGSQLLDAMDNAK